MLRDRLPTVPLVLTHPQRARRRAEREPVSRLIHVERVAVGEIVGVLLRQALREHLEAASPVPSARHDHSTLHRDTLLVAHPGHEPGRARTCAGAGSANPGGTPWRRRRVARRAGARKSTGGRGAPRRRRTTRGAWGGATETRPAPATTPGRGSGTAPRAACRTTASPARCRVPPPTPTPAPCSTGWACRNWAPGPRSPRAWWGTRASRTAPTCVLRPASGAT